MNHVGYLAALAGGVLALLSPCSALLLPAFFAYAFQEPRRLVGRTAVFYAGLAAVLVPLGVGSSAVAGLFLGHRGTLVLAAGWVIIAMGIIQMAGKGFGLAPARRWMGRLPGESVLSVFGLGAGYGLAGFCTGPILGAILTVAATSGSPAAGGALLAVYAGGMVAPLLLLALLWRRWRIADRGWLRGRAVTAGPLRLHTTSLVSGLLFVALGAAFLAFGGTAGLSISGLTGVEAAAQRWAGAALGGVPDIVLLLGAAAVAVAVLSVRWRARIRAAAAVRHAGATTVDPVESGPDPGRRSAAGAGQGAVNSVPGDADRVERPVGRGCRVAQAEVSRDEGQAI